VGGFSVVVYNCKSIIQIESAQTGYLSSRLMFALKCEYVITKLLKQFNRMLVGSCLFSHIIYNIMFNYNFLCVIGIQKY